MAGTEEGGGDKQDGLRFGAVPASAVHLCVDMQRLFAEGTPWETPWMPRVVPRVRRIVEAFPANTIFTRFIPAERPGEGRGTWARYYRRWASMTLQRLDPGLVDLVPELARFVPPAALLDKRCYSPWYETDLEQQLATRGTDTLVVTGAETDVCVLSAVLGAVDRGFRVIVVTDAVCSSADDTHDALIRVYHRRYGQQVETATAAALLAAWTEGAPAKSSEHRPS